MRDKREFPFKVALGYAFFVVMLGVALLFIRHYTRSAIRLSDVEQAVALRSNAVNRLVHGLFDVENRERALCLGQTDSVSGYVAAVDRAVGYADSLSLLLDDRRQRQRVDSLRLLLADRRDNTLRLVGVLNAGRRQGLYELTTERLRSGRDSLVVRRNVGRTVEEKKVTYVVEKTGSTFFGRLADAFRRSRADTTSMRVDTLSSAADSVSQSINVADTVADVLAAVGRRESLRRAERRDRIAAGRQALQESGIELTARAEQLLRDISRDEQLWMQKAGAADAARRRSMMLRVGGLAVASVVLAVALLALVWRDNRRAARYRRSLEEARSRAERLMEQRERLLLTITHDIKSPVSAISGFVELLRPHVTAGKAQACIENIRASAAHLLRLVGALLDYHQLENGRMTVRPVSFSPARLITDCVESFRPRASAAGLSLVCRPAASASVMCSADAFRIRQIAENLTGNALKYTAAGGVTVDVSVDGGLMLLSVADTGQGMTAEESRRVFTAFTRLPGAQGTDGVGLGLSITRELVALLGGSISLDTAPGRGSTFTVRLPVADVRPVDAPPATDTSAAPLPEMGNLRILAIDDDPLQLQLLTAMIASVSGGQWQVDACTGIDDMLAKARGGAFDLLLTDIEMPAMNGFELVDKVSGWGIPVVAMTAHDTIGDDDFRRAGFSACIRKPFTADGLAEAISRVARSCCPPGAAASPPASSEGAAPFRFAALTEFAAGDAAASRDILDRFREQTLADIGTMSRAAASRDLPAAGGLAHRLIPVFTMIQSPAVPLMRRLADARRESAVPAEFDEWCAGVVGELRRAVAAVDGYVAEGLS